jgi:hypothetical protein
VGLALGVVDFHFSALLVDACAPASCKLSAALIVVRRSNILDTILACAQDRPGQTYFQAPIAGSAVKAFATLAINATTSFIF